MRRSVVEYADGNQSTRRCRRVCRRPRDVDGDILHAFIWTKDDGIRPLKPLRGRTPQHVDSEAYGINEAGQVVGVSCDAGPD